MSDPLTQLLRQADGQSPAPVLDPTALPGRVRRTVRRQRQRRIIGATAASIILFLAGFLVIVVHHPNHLPPAPIVQGDTESLENIRLQATYHERVAALLTANEQASAPKPVVTDAFLRQLQFERSKAALVLVNGANDRLLDDPTNIEAIRHLRQAVALFPDTPAGIAARQQINKFQDSKRQS